MDLQTTISMVMDDTKDYIRTKINIKILKKKFKKRNPLSLFFLLLLCENKDNIKNYI